MKKLRVWHISLIVIIVLGLGGGGYYLFRDLSDNTSEAPAAQEVAVVKGNIANSVSASGSLVFPTKKTLSFGSSGTIGKINVKLNERVKEGQVLATLDSNSIAALQQAVTQARINLLTAQTNLTKVQTPYSQLDIDNAQLSVINAQIALQNAQNELTKVLNPSATEINQAQLAVINARIALQNAQNELAKALNPSAAEINQAQLAVTNARIAVQNTEDDLADIQDPYSTEEINQAQLAFINARIAWQNAEAELLKAQILNQYDIAQAQLTLISCQTVLNSAEDALEKAQTDYENSALRWDPTSAVSITLEQRKSQLVIAQVNFTNAQANLAKLLAGPDEVIIAQKQQQLEVAKTTLSTTADKLEKMLNPVIDPLVLQQKQQQILNAQASLATAQDNLVKLSNPDPLTLQQKQQQVTNAQSGLTSAQDNLAKLSDPTKDPLAITQKQQQIVIAQDNLTKSQKTLDDMKNTVVDASAVEMRKIDVANAQNALDKATARLVLITIAAPFDGVVTSISLEAGANVNDNTAVLQITDQTTINVSAVLNEIDVAQVTVGQAATITLDAYANRIFQGKVAAISGTAARQSGVVSYTVTTSITVPPNVSLLEGMSANVDITYQQANDVLLIPVKAVSGSLFKPIVKVSVDGEVQEKEVKLGITNGVSYQVLDGLMEGDIVMLPAPVTTTKAGTITPATTAGSIQQFPSFSSGSGITMTAIPGGGSGMIITGRPDFGLPPVTKEYQIPTTTK